MAKQQEACPRCQREARIRWSACAKHRALTATEEAKIETDLRADWPEEAVKATVCAWQKHLDSVAKARRDSHARQKEEEAESDRLHGKNAPLRFRSARCVRTVCVASLSFSHR